MSAPTGDPKAETAAQRQARLRTISALQRDALDARWQQLAPTLERVDSALARLRQLRRNPLALGLLAISASSLLVSRRGRQLIGGVRTGWRLAMRAATVVSLWQAVRPPPAKPLGTRARYARNR
ncbi:MAG TPA: YqjK family protein [Burkholderiaceae bacterium]|nr:YqjK family protein [Burkholderiaceae bacterium]